MEGTGLLFAIIILVLAFRAILDSTKSEKPKPPLHDFLENLNAKKDHKGD